MLDQHNSIWPENRKARKEGIKNAKSLQTFRVSELSPVYWSGIGITGADAVANSMCIWAMTYKKQLADFLSQVIEENSTEL